MDEPEVDVMVRPSRTPLILGSVFGLLIGAGGGFAAASYMQEEGEVAAESTSAVSGTTQTVQLGEFTVNLRNNAAGQKLQMSISVLVSESDVERFTLHQAQMRDAVLVMASDKTAADLDGADSKIDFRNEVQSRLNGVLGGEYVRAVYLTRFVFE